MFESLKKLKYGVRVMLSRGGGQPETVDVNGRPTVVMHNGDGTPFIYLHSTLGEAAMWLPFFQTWSKQFRVVVPTHPGFGQSGGFDEIDTIEDMAFHYIELLDILGLEQVCLGGVQPGRLDRGGGGLPLAGARQTVVDRRRAGSVGGGSADAGFVSLPQRPAQDARAVVSRPDFGYRQADNRRQAR